MYCIHNILLPRLSIVKSKVALEVKFLLRNWLISGQSSLPSLQEDISAVI